MNQKSSLREVLQFVSRVLTGNNKHGFAPGEGPAGRKASVTERTLQMRLKTYRGKPEIISDLRQFDRHGLLDVPVEKPVAPMPAVWFRNDDSKN
jgi:hypothetical protein